MPLRAGADRSYKLETPGVLLVSMAGLLGIFVYLVPAGSFPVGFDVWWNLTVAEHWATHGFPERMPQAGFTALAHHFADRQLGFHGLIAAVGGPGLDHGIVPPLVWSLAAAQAAVLFACMRALRPRASAWWLLVLPALSATWLFRLTALRDMALAILPLLVLVTLQVRYGRLRPAWFVATLCAAAGFAFVHGAVVLPLALCALICVGRRLAARSYGFASLWPVVVGVAIAVVARPDFPHDLDLLWTLNFRMPWAALTGALPIQPSEFAAPSLRLLLRMSAPFVIALSSLVWLTWRRALDFRLAVPAIALGAGALFASRLLELAVPFTVLALATSVVDRRPWIPALLAVAVLPWQIGGAAASARANRYNDVAGIARWIATTAEDGDTVFVTDWGLSSPLAWWSRDRALRFTGMTDPSLMWHEDRAAFDAWWKIKSARDRTPVATTRRLFGARYIVVADSDAAPGRPTGETAAYLHRAVSSYERRGGRVVTHMRGRFRCYRLGR